MARKLSFKSDPRRNHRRLGVILGVLVAINVAVIVYHGDPRDSAAAQQLATQKGYTHTNHDFVGPPLPKDYGRRLQVIVLKAGQTPASALIAAGVASSDVTQALKSLSRVMDFRRMRPGDTLRSLTDRSGKLWALEITRGAQEEVRTERDGDLWTSIQVPIPVDTVTAEVSAAVKVSLWEAILSAGEDPRLVSALVNVFASEVDFYTDINAGDTFRLIVEKRYARGQFIEYGQVLAAEIVTEGVSHRAFWYASGSNKGAFYDQNGRSLKKQLLKTPLQYANVTSRFGSRMHPVLGTMRNHNGTDYGAPVGTPVWAVGDGRVVKAGWSGGFGNLVEVSHPNGWTTQYAHLSRVNVRVGQQVRQKDLLGLVGTTGLSTGPHLHFGLLRNGHYVNSLAQKFDRAQPLVGEDLQHFNQVAQALWQSLERMAAVKAPREG